MIDALWDIAPEHKSGKSWLEESMKTTMTTTMKTTMALAMKNMRMRMQMQSAKTPVATLKMATCNNKNCWIRVNWEPPPREIWMSCLWVTRLDSEKLKTWMSVEGTHRDLRWGSLSGSLWRVDLQTDNAFLEAGYGPHLQLTPRAFELG